MTSTPLWALLTATHLACGGASETDPMQTEGSTGEGVGSTSAAQSSSRGDGASSSRGDGTSGAVDTSTSTSTSTSPSTSTTGTGEDSSTGALGCAGACLNVPAGWSGPYRVGEAACEGDFPTAADPMHRDVLVDAGSCSCSCAAATDLECDAFATIRWYDNPTVCLGGFGSSAQAAAGICVAPFGLSDFGPGGQMEVTGPPIVAGGCQPMQDAELPEPSWGTTLERCGVAADFGACDDATESCTPTSEEGNVCITRPGEFDCSDAGPFSEAAPAAYTEFVDTRSCTDCGCGPPSGNCIVDGFDVHDQPICGGFPDATIDVGAASVCTPAPDFVVESLRVSGFTAPVDLACTPTPSTFLGQVVEGGVVSVCCLLQ